MQVINKKSSFGIVDPFSLYLSLREATGKRIETALEDLMKEIQL